MDWEQVRVDFEWDGSRRDIYVLGAARRDWEAIWTALRKLEPPPVFGCGDYSGPMPADLDWSAVFNNEKSNLAVLIGKTTFNCRFFGETEVEFDFDPRSVEEMNDVASVTRFMALLGDATKKSVILTPENAPRVVIARYEPYSADVIWPPQGASENGEKRA